MGALIHAEDRFTRVEPVRAVAAHSLPAGVTKSGAAGAAQAIRAELKAAYPGIKFSVRSETYSMGSSVHIHWTDGPLSCEVEKIVDKYQMGHFDGMTDMYEYSNHDPNLPQAKYVSTERSYSPEAKARARAEIEEHYGIDLSDERAVKDKFNRWPDTMIRDRLEQRDTYF